MTTKTKLHVISFGFRHGIPRQVSVVLDCRAIRNPQHDPLLAVLTGLDTAVQEQVMQHPMASTLLEHAYALVKQRLFVDGRQSFVLGIGCMGGRHRSVVIAEQIGGWVFAEPVKITHRDIGKRWTPEAQPKSLTEPTGPGTM